MTTHAQTEPYYELHRNFASRYRCRVARRLGVPAVTLTAYYAVMHDLASNAGTFGEFTTDVRAFEEAMGMPERFGVDPSDLSIDRDLAEIWKRLERAKVVELMGDPAELSPEGLPAEFRVRVLGMASRPRKQAKPRAEVQKDYRNRQKAKAGALPNVTGEGNALLADVTLRGSSHPAIHPAIHPSKVSKTSGDAGARGLTLKARVEVDSGTEYEIDRLLPLLTDRDAETRNVLMWLASLGATEADFADARAALQACSVLKPAAYAVRTIQNRLQATA